MPDTDTDTPLQINAIIDPLDKHPELTTTEVGYYLGSIPEWIANYIDTPTAEPLSEFMLHSYGFGGAPMGGTVNDAGVYSYPEDPDLYPLVSLTVEDKTVLLYAYSITTIIEDNTAPLEADNVTTYRFD
tara:strand:+ start:147 stop:533 length:387 start_codon:yes stop_codon:yes gene_type:complete